MASILMIRTDHSQLYFSINQSINMETGGMTALRGTPFVPIRPSTFVPAAKTPNKSSYGVMLVPVTGGMTSLVIIPLRIYRRRTKNFARTPTNVHAEVVVIVLQYNYYSLSPTNCNCNYSNTNIIIA